MRKVEPKPASGNTAVAPCPFPDEGHRGVMCSNSSICAAKIRATAVDTAAAGYGRGTRMKLWQCPSCNGNGGYVDVICDDGTGPREDCGFCRGTGNVSRRMFYEILGYVSWYRRREKQRKLLKGNKFGGGCAR